MHCLVSMLKKLRPVVCGLTLYWSRGVHMNPKGQIQEYEDIFENLKFKISSKL